ncbi:Cell division protein ZipA [Arenibacter antarcticus]|uniref:Energy transducer TonB n=1 Tax=Arenibacter antarcticus TaxID=2040469 RepID=A0ABW5VC37_9FLAO|nr:energy transducer TonB [Arenibacter sp. H213]MCM4168364.1 energy transducer TonB [Arenibacter sp. H213]
MSLLNTKHEKKSFTLTTLLLSVLLLLLFYIGLTYLDPPIENGISVNFGTTEFGSGRVQPKEKVRSEPVNKPIAEPKVQEEKVEAQIPKEEVAKEKPAEKVLTQDNEESVLMKQQQVAKRKANEAAKKAQAETDRVAREKKEAEERLQQEQQAKKNKLDQLIGGINKSEGTASGSEGNDNKAGDKGRPEGDPYATSYYGSPGSGSGTGGYGLNGRSLVRQGKVPQECNQEGRVVVKIVVNRDGEVINATPGVKGTTNSHPCLLEPAKATALKHKWNLDSNAPTQQTGFVVVNFKLGE